MYKSFRKIEIISFANNEIEAPVGIIEGLDKNIWLTSTKNNKICKIEPNSLSISCYSNNDNTTLNYPANIYPALDGCVWVTCVGSNGIVRLASDFESNKLPYTFYQSEHTIEPLAIKTDKNGLVWFSLRGKNAIGSINPLSENPELTMKIYEHPDIKHPSAIYINNKNELFFMNTQKDATGIGRLNCDSHDILGTLKIYRFPDSSVKLRAWAEDIKSRIWFTGFNNTIAMFDPAEFSENLSLHIFQDPVLNMPDGICLGADGCLWFTNSGSNQIGRFEPNDENIFAHMEFYTHDKMEGPFDIKPDSNGRVWFTNKISNNVGFICTI
ncbi:MAG: hypothetical protein ACK5Z5_02000 [Neisseriaceae bacterium]